jgi:lipopolysaccharide/colanic/teichoic acid biosynthesis glycosyltransferase
MDYGELSLPDGYPLDAVTPDNRLSPVPLISTDQSNLHTLVPKALIKLAPLDTWHFATVEDVQKRKLKSTTDNLYVDQILIKAHNPNLLFELVSRLLVRGGYFAFRIVTVENIKCKLQLQLSPRAFVFYYTGHFVFRRVLPKLKGFREICRFLKLPVDISKAEIMGRLIYKGFDIVDLIETGSETLVIAKVNHQSNPSASKPIPNEGVLFSMQRVGKQGKPITVYKFRSMHPYAEYVQEYLHKTNGIDAGGKFKNDFRVSTGGRLIRKYWIDELPMLVNLVKGDIKLVGVRPISEHYFSLYPASAQQIRRRHKPGLFPPFYADLPTTFDRIVQSEVTYLTQYERNPFQTDLTYLFKILKNIVFYQARSK